MMQAIGKSPECALLSHKNTFLHLKGVAGKKKRQFRLVISPEGGWSENLKVLFQIPDYKFALNSSKPKTT